MISIFFFLYKLYTSNAKEFIDIKFRFIFINLNFSLIKFDGNLLFKLNTLYVKRAFNLFEKKNSFQILFERKNIVVDFS